MTYLSDPIGSFLGTKFDPNFSHDFDLSQYEHTRNVVMPTMGFTGMKHSDVTKKKFKELAKAKIGNKNPFFGKTHSDETKQKIRDKKLGVPSGIQPMLGKKHSEESKRKISDGGKGRVVSEETKRLIGQSKKGVPRAKVTCPHCSKVGATGIMHRWHFDNCKSI